MLRDGHFQHEKAPKMVVKQQVIILQEKKFNTEKNTSNPNQLNNTDLSRTDADQGNAKGEQSTARIACQGEERDRCMIKKNINNSQCGNETRRRT